jgi:hypothetical protein
VHTGAHLGAVFEGLPDEQAARESGGGRGRASDRLWDVNDLVALRESYEE